MAVTLPARWLVYNEWRSQHLKDIEIVSLQSVSLLVSIILSILVLVIEDEADVRAVRAVKVTV